METKLERISQLSKENPEMVFTSIGHLIDKELLKDCHKKMDGKKAVGIDGITKEDYGEKLDEKLDILVSKLKRHAYKPQPARKQIHHWSPLTIPLPPESRCHPQPETPSSSTLSGSRSESCSRSLQI